ncbi:MAG: HD-GYP domain-containing protein [Minwuia sp.]|uniref:HD-GYP domain-containing protein n=1 Tax=Minwuia sp. TaxID=2493630 RepID=UPI003A872ED5
MNRDAQTGGAEVVLIHDGRPFAARLSARLGERFRIGIYTVDAPPPPDRHKGAATVFSLADAESGGAAVRATLRAEDAVFVLADARPHQRQMARALGAGNVFAEAEPAHLINGAVIQAVNQAVESAWQNLSAEEQRALQSSVKSFGSLMTAGRNGEPLPMAEIHAACEDIRVALGVSDVDRWMNALSGHHDGTYRHSMYVCGALAFFAHEIGIKGSDLMDLTTGGFLHDVGKSRIPLAILDKPGKLDEAEWETMKGHPGFSREIMLREHGLEERIVRMAVHHHEKLDGTGYPDALSSAQIDDPTRLTAIADVYAALTEERAYKPAMPKEKAFGIMSSFKGHLDMDLLSRFREFMLDSSRETAAAPAKLSA